jgi:hypothetical protein
MSTIKTTFILANLGLANRFDFHLIRHFLAKMPPSPQGEG